MHSCPWENQIDDYLLKRLEESERDRFEEHYFNCAACFGALEGRDLLVRAVKAAGAPVPAAEPARRREAGIRILRPWMAAAAAVLVLGIVFGPGLFHKRAAWTPPTADTVRGGAIVAVAPRGDAPEAPAALEWKPMAEGIEYSVTLSGPGVEWSGRTRQSNIDLPEKIRGALRPGADYRWQVKAFAPQGYFTGNSETLTFRILR
jgi:hypothetical protein